MAIKHIKSIHICFHGHYLKFDGHYSEFYFNKLFQWTMLVIWILFSIVFEWVSLMVIIMALLMILMAIILWPIAINCLNNLMAIIKFVLITGIVF